MSGLDILRLNLRHRLPADDIAFGRTRAIRRTVPASEMALLICDMWDGHWCQSAMRRCDALAWKMAPVVEDARTRGIQIIHAPSNCLNVYEGTPARRRMAETPAFAPPSVLPRTAPPLPIDDTDGGCNCLTQCETSQAWTRQHPAIRIADTDTISESGVEVYNFLRRQGITHLLFAGVHTNMCILGRSFGIRQMTQWGISCALVRDLTDSLYNPQRHPYVSHDHGTRLVVAHIETYWCPSLLSTDLRIP
jgi:nicotinamidase-related amidase